MLCDPEVRLTAEQVLNHTWVANLAPNSEDSVLNLDLQTMKNYSNSNKFKKAVLTFIASRLKDDEIHNLKDIFFTLDKNSDGTLTFEEMKEGCKILKSDLNFEEIFSSLDTDKSGRINYTEFLAATIDQKIYLKNERLFEAFKSFDKDGSGKISVNEITNIINAQKDDDLNSIREEVEKFDANGDGEIDYEEFCNMMGNLNVKK
jgi:calcium-dependent protein kinase